MRIDCWAVQTSHGLVKDFRDPLQGFKTMTFRTKGLALAWVNSNPAYRARPVKISITISVKDF